MKKGIFSIILSLIFIMTFVPNALAAPDKEPPVLNGITLDKSEYALGETITVTALAWDISGLDTAKCYAYFVGSTGCTFTVSLNTLCESGIQGNCTLDKLEGGPINLKKFIFKIAISFRFQRHSLIAITIYQM